MTIELALNILIILLLVPTIGFAFVLNKKLTDLRKNRDDLARVINSFNEATMRAEAGIPKLRQAADEAGQQLREQVERAQGLRDDLAYMIERGEQMADRLENSVRQARSETKPAPKPGPKPAAAAGPSLKVGRDDAIDPAAADGDDKKGRRFEPDDERSEAERELLRALQSAR